MIRPMVALLGCVVLIAVGPARADDDPIKAKLDKAKAAYDTQQDKFRKDVLAKLDERATAARKKGDGKLIDKLADEKQAFEKDNIVPASLAPQGFQRQQNQFRTALETAYKAAAKEYRVAKKDDEARGVEKEFDQFVESFDALKADTVWGGEHSQKFGTNPKVTKQGVKFTVTDRKGNSFKGDVVVENGANFPVEGTIELGALSFKDTKKGHKYKGKVEGKVLTATFEGFSGALNTSTTGSWKLELTK